MKKAQTLIAFVTAAALAGGVNLSAAQDPAQRPQAPRPEAPRPEATAPQAPADRAADAGAEHKFMRGELVKVDVDAKTITIKHMNGAMQSFRYSDATEVAESQDGVSGLATKAGTKVKVHFTGEGEARMATKIEVDADAK
jgi:Cu/Ag efflux protein CusF